MVVGIIPDITPDFYRIEKLGKGNESLRGDLETAPEYPWRSSAKSRLLFSGERSKRGHKVPFQW